MSAPTNVMPRTLMLAFVITDGLFLAYWILSALGQAGLLHIPATWMYAHYDEPRVAAWNWSFLPLDLAFSLIGFAAVGAARRGLDHWRALAVLSLAFTMAAGGMAVSYWALTGEIDWSWFAPNLALVIWPLFFLNGLICPAEQALNPRWRG